MSTSTNTAFHIAAKRFQQRARISEPVTALRTAWSHNDVAAIAPHEPRYEDVYILWNLVHKIFNVLDAEDALLSSHNNNNNNNSQQSSRQQHHANNNNNALTPTTTTVAEAFLQLQRALCYNLDGLLTAGFAFQQMVQRTVPLREEFEGAGNTYLSLLLSGFAVEASVMLEHIVVGALAEARDAEQHRQGGGGGNDDDALRFDAEERGIFESLANLLRTTCAGSSIASADAQDFRRTQASMMLGNGRSLFSQPTNLAGLAVARDLTERTLLIFTNGPRDLERAVQGCGGLSGRPLWFCAGMCSLVAPNANLSQISQFIGDYRPADSGETLEEWEMFVMEVLRNAQENNNQNSATGLIASFQAVCDTMYQPQNAQQAGAEEERFDPARARVLCAMAAAHVADLCCDLSDPDELAQRNAAVARYAEQLFDFDASLWSVALSYLVASPLMEPSVVTDMLCRAVATAGAATIEQASRFFLDYLSGDSSNLQRGLRGQWQRHHGDIDWPSIFETQDVVWEESYRALCLDVATSRMWPEASGRYCDAINLLVSSGNCTAADRLLREALDAFVVEENSISNNNNAAIDRVVIVGAAAALGLVADPALEGRLQRRQTNSLVLAPGATSRAAPSALQTPLVLCRRVSELYTARDAINVLDFILPLITDPNFVSTAPRGVRCFALRLAAQSVPRCTSMQQLLDINCVLQQCAPVREEEQQQQAAAPDRVAGNDEVEELRRLDEASRIALQQFTLLTC